MITNPPAVGAVAHAFCYGLLGKSEPKTKTPPHLAGSSANVNFAASPGRQSDKAKTAMEQKVWRVRNTPRLLMKTHPGAVPGDPGIYGIELQERRGKGAKSRYVTGLGDYTALQIFDAYCDGGFSSLGPVGTIGNRGGCIGRPGSIAGG